MRLNDTVRGSTVVKRQFGSVLRSSPCNSTREIHYLFWKVRDRSSLSVYITANGFCARKESFSSSLNRAVS